MNGIFNLFGRLGQRGQSILMVALSLPVFMFLLAIVFDLGMYFVQASRLQNAADAAALAGAAVYTNNCTTKLISKPSDMDFDDPFETIYDKEEVDEHAGYYIRENSNDSYSINDADTGLWYAPIIATLVDHFIASYIGLYCYRVDLKELVPSHFAKYCSFDTFDVTASAVALAILTAETVPDDDDIDELIKVVNANIYKTAPNLTGNGDRGGRGIRHEYEAKDPKKTPEVRERLKVISSKVSALITVNLDANFRGVIYAPYSKVYVHGFGKIDEFILAAEIEDHGASAGNLKFHIIYSEIPV